MKYLVLVFACTIAAVSAICDPIWCEGVSCPVIEACEEGYHLRKEWSCACCDSCVKILYKNDACLWGLGTPNHCEDGLECVKGKCKKIKQSQV